MLKSLTKLVLGASVVVGGAVSLSVVGTLGFSGVAHADSCWDHNGSIMRLKASGNNRWMYYERPRSVLSKAGVRRGTLLFNGRKSGNWYSGTARRFSRYCPGSPLEYHVEGPVSGNQLRVVVEGSRDVYNRCQFTGRSVFDTLVFTYSHKC